MNIYLDIETIPGQSPELKDEIAAGITPPASMKKPETIAKWAAEQKPAAVEAAWRKCALEGDRGEIVCIAWAIDEGPVRCVHRGVVAGDGKSISEASLIEAFYQGVIDARLGTHGAPPVYIGHNVRDFDLRFIFQRTVILGLYPSVILPHDARPGSQHIYDTMEAWAGWRNRISLDRLCRALQLPVKGSELDNIDIDGAKVWDFVAAGQAAMVAEYCKADVERVRALHKCLTFINALDRRVSTTRIAPVA